MGFATAFVGSITLTSSILYLSLATHKRNRLEQSLILRESALRLRRIVDPSIDSTNVELHRSRADWRDTINDRWNEELEDLAMNVQNMDLTRLREMAEERVAKTWGKVLEQVKKSPKDSP